MNIYTKKRKRLFLLKNISLLLTIISFILFLIFGTVTATLNFTLKSDLNSLKKPISILVMGGDNGGNRETVALVDSIMIMTINPNNERDNVAIDVLSIPRDTEVEYSCSPGEYGKINSTFAFGQSTSGDEQDGIDCTVESVEQLLDTTIDYYAYTNFDGLITVIDSIGGINLNVPYAFCEQNSTGLEDEICFDKGSQTLNGEQSLAYARQRKAINPDTNTSGDDWERNIRQQEILASIMSKVLSNPSKYALSIYGILDEAVNYNIPLSVMTNLANFGVNNYNSFLETLSSQGDVKIYHKNSSYDHNVGINSSENLFGLSSFDTGQTLSDLYPELAKDNILYYENTNVNLINYNYKNTKFPTVNLEDGVEKPKLTIEFSMSTIGTSSNDVNSNQIISEESLNYYRNALSNMKKQK